MTRSSNAVFISYASEDTAAAQSICAALRAAGVEVWFDQNELRGGDAWDRQIRRQINECALFIAVISAQSDARDEGYFRREWRLAVERTQDMAEDTPFLLPVAIDATVEASARVPDQFRRVQWTYLAAGAISQAFVARVAGLLAHRPARADGAAPRPAAGVAPAPRVTTLPSDASSAVPGAARAPARNWRARIALAIGVVALAAIALAAYLRSAHPSVTAQAGATDKSIAVLPFIDMSEKRDQEYFSDGLTEELIDHLAHAPELRVVSRTSSFQFKGRNEDVRAIAGKLGVANVLEGSVRKAGDELRVTAQLIRASDGTHLWSQTYDRGLEDIFKLQDEIATTVSHALQVALGPAAPGKTASPATTNIEAYTSFLKGNFYWNRGNTGDNERAIEQYLKAIEQQPDYALAWAQLGRTYMWQSVVGEIPASEGVPKARHAAERALAIDPNCAMGYYTMGQIYRFYDYDWKAAMAAYEKSAALDPQGPVAWSSQGDIAILKAMQTRDESEAKEVSLRILAVNPVDTDALMNIAEAQREAGEYDASVATLRRVLDINPQYATAHAYESMALLLMGKAAEALAEAQQEPDELSRLSMLAAAYWTLGNRKEADASLHALEAKYTQSQAYVIATTYAWRGDKDAAFAWLERAYRQRDGNIPIIKLDPMVRGLRGDPRYHALLKKMNLADEVGT
jgi:TolB-like protein/Flp pilus assembly protein TadD